MRSENLNKYKSRRADELVESARSHSLSRQDQIVLIENAVRNPDLYGIHGMMTIVAFVCARELLVPSIQEAIRAYFISQMRDVDLIDSYISSFTVSLRIDRYDPLKELLDWLTAQRNM